MDMPINRRALRFNHPYVSINLGIHVPYIFYVRCTFIMVEIELDISP